MALKDLVAASRAQEQAGTSLHAHLRDKPKVQSRL
jgi:hypothetical protein